MRWNCYHVNEDGLLKRTVFAFFSNYYTSILWHTGKENLRQSFGIPFLKNHHCLYWICLCGCLRKKCEVGDEKCCRTDKGEIVAIPPKIFVSYIPYPCRRAIALWLWQSESIFSWMEAVLPIITDTDSRRLTNWYRWSWFPQPQIRFDTIWRNPNSTQ